MKVIFKDSSNGEATSIELEGRRITVIVTKDEKMAITHTMEASEKTRDIFENAGGCLAYVKKIKGSNDDKELVIDINEENTDKRNMYTDIMEGIISLIGGCNLIDMGGIMVDIGNRMISNYH